MARSIRLAAAAVVFLICAACISLTASEKDTVKELESYGIREHQIVKKPGTAGALNILPGIGNFYLAVGTEETAQWLYGFLNLLTWPVSVVWGIPEAAIDAGTINKQEMVYYYTHNPKGIAELEALRAKAKAAP